ncbi:hypothetical protein DF021_32805 [Burkholderia stagnalis]|uniref:Uncharacterized protein n=1 Tax=Burkholderia stagnalis TaxID=1503054 RepID=A0ABX9YDM6_9BURK|nr:hypothetical protein DF158_32875 [Burkholderia stagnalis]RQQ59814.1 hypothetical protein DF137_32990 [Burkholderia stagnalis]RQQ60181.1 hypothetical protein DF139_32955 [Burkholderia stagnalis]RQQ74742.1 hypothetical protein DF138_32385 [Burkholderia stagnalis]RQQ80339.1 hypothetical protein DF134_33220 [Burkholderia stagnalis]
MRPLPDAGFQFAAGAIAAIAIAGIAPLTYAVTMCTRPDVTTSECAVDELLQRLEPTTTGPCAIK